jgi:hypothetical protein
MPTAVDLVTDLPADFEVFGQAVATSMADLLGGTTGQILSKTTSADMDFTWITNDVGDITAVTAGTGISGGGTSGAVTITNSMATEITAKGDLIAGTGSATFDNLPVGTNGQTLVADSTASTGLKWADAATSGGMTLLSTTTLSGSSTVVSSISGSYNQLQVQISGYYASVGGGFTLRFNGDTTANAYFSTVGDWNSSAVYSTAAVWYSWMGTGYTLTSNSFDPSSGNNITTFTLPNYTDTTGRKTLSSYSNFKINGGSTPYGAGATFGAWNNTAAITSITFIPPGGTWTAGTVKIWGIK